MAGRLGRIAADADVAIANAKSLLYLRAATNFGLRIKSLWLGLKGTSVTEGPVTFRLVRTTADGTFTANNPTKKAGPGTMQATGGRNATAEPTTKGDTLWGPETMHPQGSMVINFRPDDEIIVEQSETNPQVVLECVDAAGLTINFRGGMTFEE